jgi:hypothetical protein
LEDDARHICRVATPIPLATAPPNGATLGKVHVGTIIASCYDHRSDQFSLCAQDAEENRLYTLLADAEQPALTLDGSMLAYRSTDAERLGLYAVPVLNEPQGQGVAMEGSAAITSTSTAQDSLALGTPITITAETDAHSPSWAPDGGRLAFAQYDSEEEDWFIYIALPDGETPPRRVHQGEWPAWGPSGLLAFTTCGEENDCGIYLFDPATWSLKQLTRAVQDRASGWSPSGDEIAYMSDIGRSHNLYVVNVELGHVRQITRDLFTDIAPCWSPDGQRIAYVTNRDDDWALYTLHPYGDQPERIAALGATSADGQRFRLSWGAPILRFPAAP